MSGEGLTKEMIENAISEMLAATNPGDAYARIMSRADSAKILTNCFGPKPPGWILHQQRLDGFSWVNPKRKLYVIASMLQTNDGGKWLHLSISHRKRIPTYDEMKYLKRHWAGPMEKAIEIHVADEEHYNYCERARHLWVSLDGDPLPDFTCGTGRI